MQRKRDWTKLIVAVVAALIAAPVYAAEVATETFDTLTPGDLNNQGSGSGWSGNWTATTGLESVIAPGSSLSYTFSEGGTVDGGDQAVELSGNNDGIIRRQLSSAYSGDELYVSFLVQRSGGTGGDPFDFGVWWLDDQAGGPHSDAPNIGVYDETDDNNELMARTGSFNDQSNWAEAGGSSNVGETLFVVGRLSKGNDGSSANDFDGWDLWVFDTADASRSIFDFETPDDTGSSGSDADSISHIGIRTAAFEAGDTYIYDDLRVGSKLGDVVPIALGVEKAAVDINGAHTLTFSELGNADKIDVASGDAFFTDHGISSAAGDGGTAGDNANQTVHDEHGLYVDGSDLVILQEDEGSTSFGATDNFTFEFDRDHTHFGVSFQDQVAGTFTFEFFKDGDKTTEISKSLSPNVTNTPFIVETVEAFDSVKISGGGSGDGWGIDNLLLDAVHEVGLDAFSSPLIVEDFESIATGPTGSDVFQMGELTITATNAGGGDVASVPSDDGNGLFFDGTEFQIIEANEGSTSFGSSHVYTLDFANDKDKIGMVLTDQAAGDFTFTFFLDGEFQAEYLKSLPNTNNQTFYFATDFKFDSLVVDGLVGNDGFGLDNITYTAIPEPTTLTMLALGGCMLMRRRR